MAICAINLIQNARVGYLVLALLTAAWLCYLDFMMVSALCAAALVVQFNAPRLASVVTRRVVIVVWICVAAYGLLLNVLYFEQFGRAFRQKGPGGMNYFWSNFRYIAFPISAAALALALAPRSRIIWTIEGLAVVGLAALACISGMTDPLFRSSPTEIAIPLRSNNYWLGKTVKSSGSTVKRRHGS